MRRARVVLITGASIGIGEATSRAAATRGDHVVLVARSRESLHRVAADCDGLGAASTLVAPADVSDDTAVREAVATAMDRHGRLDVVVSCAGVVAPLHLSNFGGTHLTKGHPESRDPRGISRVRWLSTDANDDVIFGLGSS